MTGVFIAGGSGLNLFDWELIDWDDHDDEDGNLVHCLQHGVDEMVVFEVLSTHPVDVKIQLTSAEFAVVGPDAAYSVMWTLLFARSDKRGDWLRPVTGWESSAGQVAAWEARTRVQWHGGR
jgi:hypothetical protein